MAIPTTLPASWYCHKPLHELERRAIFLRAWYFLGIITKFETGKDLVYEISQVSLLAKPTTGFGDDEKEVRVFNQSTVRVPHQDPNDGILLLLMLVRLTGEGSTHTPNSVWPGLHDHLRRSALIPGILSGPRRAAQQLRSHKDALPPQSELSREIQLENHDGRLPGVPALPVRPSRTLEALSPDLLPGGKPPQLVPPFRQPKG